MSQASLFSAPPLADRWQPGDRCRDTVCGTRGVVMAVTPTALDVLWLHRYHGNYRCRHGADRLLEKVRS